LTAGVNFINNLAQLYACRSQKRKKILTTWLNFYAFGICAHKSAKRCINMLVKSSQGDILFVWTIFFFCVWLWKVERIKKSPKTSFDPKWFPFANFFFYFLSEILFLKFVLTCHEEISAPLLSYFSSNFGKGRIKSWKVLFFSDEKKMKTFISNLMSLLIAEINLKRHFRAFFRTLPSFFVHTESPWKCHIFRVLKQDDYFWDNFDHF